MNTEITVQENLSVTITQIYQWQTYNGLLEGLPVERINQQILNRALEKARELSEGNPVHLIEPTLTPIPHEGSYAFGNPVELPGTICITDLRCHSSIQNLGDYSELTVVWLQEQYAFPIEPTILDKLKALPWSQLAKGFNWSDF